MYQISKEELELLMIHDENTYDKLRKQYINSLCYFIYDEYGLSIEDAKEIANDAFIKAAYIKIKLFDPEKSSFVTWLYNVAQNLAVDYKRKNENITLIEDEKLENMSSSEPNDGLNLILNEIKSILSEEDFEIFVDAYVYEKDMTEIAQEHQIARMTVYRKLKHAKEKIVKSGKVKL